jgi:nitroreductase
MSTPLTNPPSEDSALERTLDYHEKTKHFPGRYARSLGYLKWEDQPNPFREFAGAPRIELPFGHPARDRSFGDLFSSDGQTGSDLTKESLGWFFEHSLALSAWKQAGANRWALRINPSSGNLHPTEAYAILPDLAGIGSTHGVYHYLSRDHSLELRSQWSAATSTEGFYLAFTSIPWREAWKYGERAFRYCQHDLGHALAAARFSAAILGWRLEVQELPLEFQSWLLGLEEGSHPDEPEIPEVMAWVQTRQDPPFDLPALGAPLRRFGRANQLSAGHEQWPVIGEVIAASGQRSAPPGPPLGSPTRWPDLKPVECSKSTVQIIRQRRSATGFDGSTPLPREAFLRILDQTLPRPNTPPWDLWKLPTEVHLVLFVHRVTGLVPGLYLWLRDLRHLEALRAAMRPEFRWHCDSPEQCPLFELALGDWQEFARTVSCDQDIAADGAFSLGMVARFGPVLRERGAHSYRQLFWESGVIGQTLYLGAEAAGMRATGIGCFFDDVMHDALGFKDSAWQSLYHLAVGRPVEDPRLVTLAPYPPR